MKKQISYKIVSLVFSILVFCFAIAFYIVAWNSPLQNPSGCTSGDPGCDAPINVGSVGQNKEGNLTIGGAGGLGMFETKHSTFLATADGNVGIGTSAPISNLDVRGANSSTWNKPSLSISEGNDGFILLHGNAVAGPAIAWDSDTRFRFGTAGSSMLNPDAAWSEKMTILSTGEVGIGTSSPSEKLEVDGNIVASGTICGSMGCIGGGGSLWSASGLDIYYDVAGGKVGIGTTVPTGRAHIMSYWTGVAAQEDRTVILQASQAVGPGMNNSPGIGLLDSVGLRRGGLGLSGRLNAWSNGSQPGDTVLRAGNGGNLIFATAPAPTTPANITTKLIISNAGDVGIGTTNPNARLHVVGATSEAILIDRVGGQPSIEAGAGDGYMIIESAGTQLRLNNYVSDNVILANGGGNVGIGMTSPLGNLHIYDTTWPDIRIEEPSGDIFRIAIDTSNDVVQFYFSGVATGDRFMKVYKDHKVELFGDLELSNGSILPDYVFDPDYNLMSLNELKNYIAQNKSLPGMVTADEVEEKGSFSVSGQIFKSIEKIEELTLYILELEERISQLEKNLAD